MSESYQFPVINSIGFPVLLSLRYSTSNDTPTARARVPFTVTSQSPARATWRIDFQGESYRGEGFIAEADLDTRNALGQRVAPGLYNYTATETFFYDSGARPSLQVDGRVEVRRGDIWPFGHSWISTYDTLLVDRTASVTIIQGDGQYLTFNRTASGFYEPPSPGVGTLLRFGDGSWLLTAQQGLRRWFNANGRMVKLENRNGTSHTLSYEANDALLPPGVWGLRTRLKAIRDANGGEYRFEYGPQGYIDRVTDSDGRVFTLAHDAAGDLRSVTDPLGRTTSYEYDGNHLLTRIVHPGGDETRLSYDERRRLVSHENALGDVRTGAYQNSRNVFTNERGVPTSYQFNAYGAITRVSNPAQTISYLFDAERQFVGVEQPYQRYEYDERGNRIQETSHISVRRTYDPVFNQLTSITDGARNTTRYEYDSRGNLTAIIDPAGHATRFTYDALGQLVSLSDGLDRATTTSYDSRGNPIQITDPLGNATQFTYDSRGNVVQTRDPQNQVESFTWDDMDRMIAHSDALGNEIQLQYDANDNITAFIDGESNSWTYEYDALNHRVSESDPLGQSSALSYDSTGNLTHLTLANGATISYSYDAASRRTREELSDSNIISYTWNGVNDPLSIEDNQASSTYIYANQIPGSADTLISRIKEAGIETVLGYDYVVVGSTAPGASATRALPGPDVAAAEGNLPPDPPPAPPVEDDSPPPPDSTPLPGMERESRPEGRGELPLPEEMAPAPEPAPIDAAGLAPYRAIPGALATDVCGTLSNDTTWTAASSPYVVTCDVSVPAGTRLTVEPGAVIKFKSYYEDLYVNGTLIAQGTPAQPIYFTSLADDAAGGDTNGDGDATVPEPDDWASIRFIGSSTGSVLDHVVVRYGGGQSSENVYVSSSDIAIRNSTIAWSGGSGIQFDNTLPAVLRDTSFENNTGVAVWAPLSGNDDSITLSGNTGSGNSINGFAVQGTIGGDVTWDGDVAFPFVIWADLNVQGNGSLSLTPGSVVKFQDYYDDLYVNGALIAQGTEPGPIYFTSLADDTVGGDTNGDGDATVPEPDDWASIRFNGSSTGSVLDHAVVRYGGGQSSENVYVSSSDIAIRNSTIAWSGGSGIQFDNTLPAALRDTSFENNIGVAVWAPLSSNDDSITLSGNTGSGNSINGFAVQGTIGDHVTWDGDDFFPFVIWADLTVQGNGSLTLTPGTVVKFQDYYDDLYVDGALIAQGTETQPIYFTSLKDDTVGGDTDARGATTPAPSNWASIRFNGSSTGSVLDHAVVRYGGGQSSENVYANSNDITIRNSTIAQSSGYGIYFANTLPAALTGNVFENNAGPAVWAPLSSNDDSITLSGNTGSGNGINGFAVQGSIGDHVNWDGDDFFPFVIWGDLTVQSDSSLTLTPGTVVKFNDYYDDLYVDGSLIAQGTTAKPIYFTSLQDDGPGGDSNGDGDKSSATGSDWSSLRFNSGSSGSILNKVVVRYGGGQASENIYLNTNEIALSDSTIAHAAGRGLSVIGVSPTLRGNDIRDNNIGVYTSSKAQPLLRENRITGNGDYGIYNADRSVVIDAEDNWWGSVKGPRDPDDDTASGGWYNPDGEGDRASNGVDYEPWLAFTGLLHGLSVATGDNPVQTVRYEYDELNRTSRLTAAGPVQTSYQYSYDADNQLLATGPAPGNPGVAATLSYDANARLTRLLSRNPNGNVTFSDLRYTYDAAGNILSEQGGSGTTRYAYDAAYRLISASGPGLNESYSYDGAGNRTGRNGVTYTYDAANQLRSSSDGWTYSYDASGNQVSKTRAGQSTTYHWDPRGRLIRVDYPDGSFSAYSYDAQDRRISKRDRQGELTYFVYDGFDLVQEVGADGEVLANYVYDGLDHPIAMQRGNATYYYLYDHLGSVIGLSNGFGVLVASYRYDPWGNVIASGGSNPDLRNPFRFTSREWDAESGLYYFRSRYYDPATARFISRDRIPAYKVENLYAYGDGNPLHGIDPMGLDASERRWWQGVGGVIVGFGGGLIFLATAPVSAPLFAAAGATLAGGLAGGLAAGASEWALASNCDRDILGAFVAGGKGGLTGGSMAFNVAYYYGAEIAGGMRAVGNFLRPPPPSLAQMRAGLELQISVTKRMAYDAMGNGNFTRAQFFFDKMTALEEALRKLPPMW